MPNAFDPDGGAARTPFPDTGPMPGRSAGMGGGRHGFPRTVVATTRGSGMTPAGAAAEARRWFFDNANARCRAFR